MEIIQRQIADLDAAYKQKLEPLTDQVLADNLTALIALPEVPAGLLLAEKNRVLKMATILSLRVDEKFRHQGIALKLIQDFENRLKQEQYVTVLFTYSTLCPFTPFYESMFAKLNWPIRTLSFTCRFDRDNFHPPWLERNIPYPQDLEIFFWRDRTDQDKVDLKTLMGQGRISESNFPQEDRLEPMNSLGLRYQGHLVGWMIVKRLAENTIDYQNLFILPEWQFSGVPIRLLGDALRIHSRSNIRWGLMTIRMSEVDPSWRHFVERRLVPYAVEISYTKQAWHKLKDEG